jgi:hypothetical protein
VYIDGVVAKTSASFGLERQDFSGRLVLATSSINDSWTGQIFGLAFYSQDLEREQVSKSFHRWTSATALGPAEAPRRLCIGSMSEPVPSFIMNVIRKRT